MRTSRVSSFLCICVIVLLDFMVVDVDVVVVDAIFVVG
jgi:hypothetical protein